MLKVHHLRSSFLWRYCCFAFFLARKVKVHPQATLNASLSRLMFRPGATVGRGTRISTGSGLVILEEKVWLSSDIEMETEDCIRIGSRTTVQRRATINGDVEIGEDCILAPNVFISSGTHPFREFADTRIREQERRLIERDGNLSSIHKPVRIGHDCWIGVNAVICPGVTLGDGCVVGANSVVTRDVEPSMVVAGLPAKPIGKR